MTNLRDLGGLPARDGRKVVSGLLFRASQWDDEPQLLRALGIRRMMDLRAPFERERRPCRVLPGVSVIPLFSGEAGCQRLPPLKPGFISGRGRPGEEMLARYAGFPRTQAEAMRRFFGLLLASREPTLYFCCQGKDRSGVFTAVLLEALGVAEEEIMRDYLRSNQSLEEMNRRDFGLLGEGMTEEEKAVLWSYMEVQPAYLRAFFAARGEAGRFWQDSLRMTESDRERLRDLYTA